MEKEEGKVLEMNSRKWSLFDLIEVWFKAIMYRVSQNVRSMKFKYEGGKMNYHLR